MRPISKTYNLCCVVTLKKKVIVNKTLFEITLQII